MTRRAWTSMALAGILPAVCLAAGVVGAAEPKIERSDAAVRADLGNGTVLEFALNDGFLLGLRRAEVQGVSLKSDASVVRPYVVCEWTRPGLFCEAMRLRDAAVRGSALEITVELLDTAAPEAWRDFFVHAPDYASARGPYSTPRLKELLEKKDAAEAQMRAAVTNHARYKAGEQALADGRAQLKAAKDAAGRKAAEDAIGVAKKTMAAVEKELPTQLLVESEALRQGQADIEACAAELDAVAAAHMKVHTDFYLFPITQLPSDVCGFSRQSAALAARAGKAQPVGTLKWILEPVTRNVAGWPWTGWSHRYEVDLKADRKVNCIRELGTWELGGQAAGNTLVNLRYRGLGGIVARLAPLDSAARSPGSPVPVANAFTTTEILPGAVDKAPVVSPAVPGPQNIASRSEAMKYRHGAWIAQPQRGAGVNWVDFQYRDAAALAFFYERMATVRSVTEIWPGDVQISHYDGMYFAATPKATTVPKTFLVLAPQGGLPGHAWRTRWQEMDLYARDQVARELGFVQRDPLPSIGINWDSGWEGRLKGLIANLDVLRDAGVKRILVHHPGWFNGRGLRQGETAFPIPRDRDGRPDTGGDCSMHDYVPQSDRVRDLWKELTTKMKQADMEYWVWITGMVHERGPVVEKFGKARFCRNAPEADFSSGYPGSGGRSGHRGIPILDPEFRAWWDERMALAVTELGVTGFWADSFQNMFMSQMNYQVPSAAPHNREWWQWIAAMSKRGIGWMAESQGFPGLSCSIEVGDSPHDFEGIWWVLPYVTRWYRGEPVPDKGTEKADRLFFRSMANKGPIAPGGGDPSQVPGYRRLSAEYLAALPAMKRPYQLPGEQGVLWLPADSDATGVLFAFADRDPVPGLECAPILSGEPMAAGRLRAHCTYRVRSGRLLASLGVVEPPGSDPRRRP